MCGITALITDDTPADAHLVQRMTRLIEHRGPDGEGVVSFASEPGLLEVAQAGDPRARVVIGNRRLAILDTSSRGEQPMSYRDRLWITYNGEIYNYVEIREELERAGHAFVSGNDTEVVLASYAQWGTDCFAHLRGMWGLVLVDLTRRRVVVCRDRLGIKPVYRCQTPHGHAIVSEPKQLTAIDGFTLGADSASLARYLAQGYEESDATMFEGVEQLPAGSWAAYDIDGRTWSEPEPFWHPDRVTADIHDPDEAASAFRPLFEASVREHHRSDVPLGFALSGGLDSSALAMLGARGAPTFSVVFPGHRLDESRFAQMVADSLGSANHPVTPRPETFLDEVDAFTWHHDEPVGSLSQYAGYVLAREMREHGIPVALNGQGGDELFSAYWQSYLVALRRWARSGSWLSVARELLGALGPGGNAHVWGQIPGMLRRYGARRAPAWEHLVPGTAALPSLTLQAAREMDDQAWRIYEITRLWLPRLLKWDDRNFMAHSVEGRYPFLDHRLIELCLRFSPRARYRRGWTKEPLRRAMADVLPPDVARRRTKFGFETPQADWATGAFRIHLERLSTGDSPLWGTVDRTAATALIRTAVDDGGAEAIEASIRLFLADRWSRVFRIAGA